MKRRGWVTPLQDKKKKKDQGFLDRDGELKVRPSG
jgi:hypothetical protein